MSESLRTLARRAAPFIVIGALAALLGYAVGNGGAPAAAPTASGDAHAAHDHSGDNPESPTVWTCSMHPQIQLSEPGSCPICGMDLIPVAASGGDTLAANEVQLTERARALARVRTARVERLQEAGVGARLLGRVEPDERRLSTVTTWIGGRIDRLHLRVTGERVRRGQTIATLYSPEVYSAHQDLLAAKRQLTRLAQASPETRSAAEAALESTRERLRLLGIPDSALASMEGAARPQRQVSIRSPFAGTVMARSATEGMYVQAGAALYQVADLSRVWVQLEAYERDLAGLALGQHVTLTFEAVPAREFEGTIAFIEPMVDARRRIARVRVELDNPAGVLRPGMFAQARIDALGAEDGEAPLVIPASAALFTGRRSVVYVESAHDEGTNARYAATVVRLGARQGDRYPVLAGLEEGQRVVVQGAFAIDADLQIRAGASMMAGPDDTQAGAYDDVVAVPAALRGQLAAVLGPYLDLQAALARDSLADAQAAAHQLANAVREVQPAESSATRAAWQRLETHLTAHAHEAHGASDLASARAAFVALSGVVQRMLEVFGNPLDDTLHVMHCPMAFSGAGGSWVQRGETLANPYYGEAMLTCGSSQAAVAPGEYAPGAEAPTP